VGREATRPTRLRLRLRRGRPDPTRPNPTQPDQPVPWHVPWLSLNAEFTRLRFLAESGQKNHAGVCDWCLWHYLYTPRC